MNFQTYNIILQYIPIPAKWFNLFLVNHKNKQTISGKDKS